MTTIPLNRRQFFAASSAAALSVGTAASADGKAKYDPSKSTFEYEVTRTEAEWREMLTEYEYFIMREGLTEKPKTSPLWEETAAGTYHCKGCELPVFQSNWKTVLSKGWVFFYHAEPNSVLMAIEGNIPSEYGGSMSDAGIAAITEVHCRRCGSHLGHFLIVEGLQTHCINGTSLTFKQETA